MDGKFPSCIVNGKHGRDAADNTPWGYQALHNTNHIPSQSGEALTKGNYGERWTGDLPSACPPSLHHKEPVKMMQGILSEVAPSSSSSSSSSSTHSALMAFSAHCQETTLDPIKNSNSPVYQDRGLENLRDVPEDFIERISVTNNAYNSVNYLLSAAHQQDLKRDNSSTWTSVIKESLEISNGMELEQGLLADIYDSRVVELAKNHFDPEANEIDVQERRQVTEAQEPTVINLSDDCPLKPNQEFRHKTDPLIYNSSLDDKELGETGCRTRKRCSSLEPCNATEVCSLESTKVSSFTKRRCLSEDVGCERVSLTASNSTVNEKNMSVLKPALQHSSPSTSREHVQSCNNTNTGKCMDNQTKSCSDKNATLHRHLSMPGHNLWFDAISAEPSPTYSSTSDCKDDLVHDLPEESPPTPTLNTLTHFKAPVEMSKTLKESDESNSRSEIEETANNKPVAKCTTEKPDVATIGAQSSSKLVRQTENGGMLLDDVLTSSQSHSSDEISSLNANSTSRMIINTDQETDNSQVIPQNNNVATLCDDPSQSQSLTVRSDPQTGVNCVYSLERKSPQTPTKKEAAQVEARFAHEPQLDLECKSSAVILNSITAPSLKKRKLLKMATIEERSEDVAASSGKSYPDVKIHHENQDRMSRNTSKDFHTGTSNTLQKTPSESQRKDATVMESRKQTLWNKRNMEKTHSSEVNGDAGIESSLQSTIVDTGLCKVKDGRSKNPLTDASVKVSDKHLELSEQDVDDKNSLSGPNTVSLKTSPIGKVDRFTQYCDEDHATTLNTNKDTCSVADQVISTKTAKEYITCKYCLQSFRHISAYTVHRRIHTGEKPYRCELCGKNFAQLSRLKSHRNVHVQSASFLCPCCRRTFSKKSDLIAHFTSHIKNSKQKNALGHDGKPEEDKPVSCKTCRKEFQTSLQLVDHEKTHWPVKPYACSICGKGFTRIKALKKHSEKHTGETPFSCSQCDSAFCDLSGLRAHQISKLCVRSLNRENSDIEGFLVTHGVDGEVNTPVFFKCHICKQLYQKWCQYTLHLQTHTNAPPYLCFACGQSYNKDFEINVHCSTCCQTSGEAAACGSSLSEIFQPRKDASLMDTSPTVVSSKSKSLSSAGQFHENLSNVQTELIISSQIVNASQTVNMSNDDRLPPSPTTTLTSCATLNQSLERVEPSPRLWRFECPHCGQRYKRYRSLCFHMQTHAPAFKYVCGRCGRSFKRWNKLWLHQQIHRRKDHRYTCSQCNIQFHHCSSYKMHLLNHAEVRPYACPLCPQTFVHEQGLHMHQCEIQQPARTLQRDVCARSVSNLTNLVKHNGDVSQQCRLCGFSFANSRSLQDHLNVCHNPVSLLPSIPSEPLRFLHKCNRCKSSFSTGDLLYAHQICHTRDLKHQVCSTQSSESTSVSPEGTQQVSSTSRCLLSSLDLDAVPNESLYKYSHPDRLYVPSRVSRMSKRLPIINLGSGDEDLLQEDSADLVCPNSGTGSSRQKLPENSQTDMMQQQPAPESQESVQSPTQATTDSFQNKANHNSPTKMHEHVETSVFLEGPPTTVNPAEDEIFECVDCSENLGSLIGLYEHYFLHALGNTNPYNFL